MRRRTWWCRWPAATGMNKGLVCKRCKLETKHTIKNVSLLVNSVFLVPRYICMIFCECLYIIKEREVVDLL